VTATLYRPGQKAPISGIYEIINVLGAPIGQTRPIDAGHVFPPVPNRGEQYKLKQEVNPLFTSVASKAVIDETTSTFAVAIKYLADR
jgi:hypothetical protein